MDKIYSIDKKGKIRVFQGEVSLSGPATPNTASIFTKTGLLDGKLTEKKTVIVNGKQGRSVNEQAQFELDSLYNEKLDEGYKSWDRLLTRLEWTKTLSNTEVINWNLREEHSQSVIEIFSKLNITYNTNRYWLPLPMLAEKWKEKKKSVKYPVLVQPKLNGVRCIAVWSQEDNSVILLSRGGQKYIVPQIAAILDPYLRNTVLQLDGELYKHGVPLQVIAGIVKLEDESQFKRKDIVEYHIYDLAMPSLSQVARLDILQHLVLSISNPFIHYVKTYQTDKEEHVQTFHNEFVANGYEGAIVRDMQAMYQFGFRDSCLLKVKEFFDEEFEIIGGETDDVGSIDSFIFVLRNNVNELTFGARPTGTREDKAIWKANLASYIGKKATVRFQERTVDGLPHQAHVRHKDTTILIEAIRDYE